MCEIKKIPLTGEYIIEDRESGSKAYFPIELEEKHSANLYKVDFKGRDNKENKVCDNLIIMDEEKYKISGLIELKGSGRKDKVADSWKQLNQSFDRYRDLYFEKSKISLAIVAGAPDKTLPQMINNERKNLCKKLHANSLDKEKFKSIDNHIVYIQPDNNIKKTAVIKRENGFVIKCHAKHGLHVNIPRMLMDVIK